MWSQRKARICWKKDFSEKLNQNSELHRKLKSQHWLSAYYVPATNLRASSWINSVLRTTTVSWLSKQQIQASNPVLLTVYGWASFKLTVSPEAGIFGVEVQTWREEIILRELLCIFCVNLFIWQTFSDVSYAPDTLLGADSHPCGAMLQNTNSRAYRMCAQYGTASCNDNAINSLHESTYSLYMGSILASLQTTH